MIAIIEYNAGNSTSVKNALNRLGYDATITRNEREIQQAQKVIFPGVGEAKSAMRFLRKHDLDQLIPTLKQPVLGICLGMQLFCSSSEENETDCLGIIPVKVKRFPPKDIIPHMGWNNFTMCEGPLFDSIHEQNDVYFVHSYYVERSEYTTAVTNYIVPFSAAVQKDNFYAVQFHPEKSGEVGETLLQNFMQL